MDVSLEEGSRAATYPWPPGVRLFGVPIIADRPFRNRNFNRIYERSPEPESVGPNFTVRVVKLRVLLRSGTRARLHPISSIRCSKMLNRILGILFRSDSREIPVEVRSLFSLGKIPSGQSFYLSLISREITLNFKLDVYCGVNSNFQFAEVLAIVFTFVKKSLFPTIIPFYENI